MMTHRVITAVALAVFTLLAARAVLTLDPYYDTLSYHLPFAARLAGLCDPACYRMYVILEDSFEGFPKLLHWLNGLIWRWTGSPQYADVLNLTALVLFALYLRQRFAVPAAWTLLGLLAVPVILIHSTSSYVDLVPNLAVAATILGLMVVVREPAASGWHHLILIAACLALAANSKLQMLGVVGVLGVAFVAAVVLPLLGGRRVGPFASNHAASWLKLALFFGIAGSIVATTAIANLIAHGNPFFPVAIDLAGLHLPGSAAVADGLASNLPQPPWRDLPEPLRWLGSVLEVGAFGFREVPWTIDQGYCERAVSLVDCWREPTASYRMGGFFGVYVIFLLVFLGWWLASAETGGKRLLGATLALTTALAAFLPHAHTLRYYQFWMILLVALALIAAFDPRHAAKDAQCRRQVLGIGILIALVAVTAMTEGRYLTPVGPTPASLIHDFGIHRKVATIEDGATVCVDPRHMPLTFLFAEVFHPGHHYGVLDGPIASCTQTIGPEGAWPSYGRSK